MKLKFFSVTLLISILILSSCEKIIDELQFKDIIIPTSTEISLPLVGEENTRIEHLPDIDLNIDIKKEVNDLDKLKKAALESFKIKKKNNNDLPTLKVIKDADLYLISRDFPTQKIASVKNNTNTNEINFKVVEGIDLTKFIKSEDKKFSLRNILIGETSTSTTEIPLIVDLEWKVTIGL